MLPEATIFSVFSDAYLSSSISIHLLAFTITVMEKIYPLFCTCKKNGKMFHDYSLLFGIDTRAHKPVIIHRSDITEFHTLCAGVRI